MIACISRTKGILVCGRFICRLIGLHMTTSPVQYTPLIGTLFPSTPFIILRMADTWEKYDVHVSFRAMHAPVLICANHSEIFLWVCSYKYRPQTSWWYTDGLRESSGTIWVLEDVRHKLMVLSGQLHELVL